MGFNTGLMVAMLMSVLAFTVISGFLFSGVANYDADVGDEFQDIFDKYEEINSEYQNQQSTIDEGEIDPTNPDQGIFSNALVAGRQLMQGGELFFQFVVQLPRIFPVTSATIGILVTIVFFLSMVGFIRLAMKEEP